MTRLLLYQPRQRWRAGIAFAAAVVVHFAAIAIAHVHSSEQSAPSGVETDITEVFLDAPSPPPVSEPAPPDPLPTPAQVEQPFPEEKPSPPPIRRTPSRSLAPLVKARSTSSTASLTISSARVFALSAPRPEYPYEARRQKIAGDGIVGMTVNPGSGEVVDVSMLKSTGSPFLDNAALAGFRRWRFKPGTVSSVRCPITFTLNGASY